MKQITNKEYEEWQKYKEEKAKGHILMPDTLRFICAANDYDPTKIGQHFRFQRKSSAKRMNERFHTPRSWLP